ncbi:enoyl-CoA hydratase/isomerase family protein [Pseudarthrobacter sp. NIBRBAC000502772]|uniref:enoyl-CoA hydratase/isomerase family protein n=1 Tax=Pseudarthrobacter sp. NIBRBAC000502772 TaxID=2590775 RepID=UPI001130D17F|nr:enoyl-CoA hydratase/isomerase family protein [Pseudarthrobacter sp. NIBRBAC000502772]QDG66692.1 enoyl-CoA hydratase/isomerase family protein [Pseudarthrobacter sp. NIBRBAC000502772]
MILNKDIDPVHLDVADGVGHIRLNRPQSGNALNLDAARLLAEVAEHIAGRDDIRSVLITGTGSAFCVGGDVAAMANATDRGEFLAELAGAAHRAIRVFAALQLPIVSAVSGAAAGAGLALTLVSDLVIAGRSAKFLVAYSGVGLTPDCGTSWLLPQVIGLRRAQQLALTNQALDATEALNWGLISSVVDDDQVETAGSALATRLATKAPTALGQTRGLLRASVSNTLIEHLDLEAATIATAAASNEAGALIDSFLNRRT